MTDDTQAIPLRVNLGAIPLFKDLSADALARVSSLTVGASFAAGDTIFLEQEPGDALYVIETGRVRVWVRDARSQSWRQLAPTRCAALGDVAESHAAALIVAGREFI